MMILSQDGMVAVNSDNVAMFEVKETEARQRNGVVRLEHPYPLGRHE